MDILAMLNSQRKQIAGFFLAILAVIACFFGGWILVVLSPVIVFLVFKFLRVWKNKERAAYGIPAIMIGIAIFLLIYAYQVADTPYQKFSYGNLELTVEPYITSDYSKNFSFKIVYDKATNSTLHCVITDEIHRKTVWEGDLNGTIRDNKTYYNLTRYLGEGIYYLKFKVGKDSVDGEVIKATPNKLYQYFMYYSGFITMALLSILYLLLLFGVHLIRRGREFTRLRYEREEN